MQGKATLSGHPLHPILVTFPIGCFVAAVVADLISIWEGPAFWAEMSTWLILFGIVGGLIAAFSGFVDYISAPMTARAKNVASWHMTLNVAMLVIFGLACALRFLNYHSVGGHALTGLGIVLLAISGWLGGEVAHRYLVGSPEPETGTADRTMRATEASERGELSTPSARIR